MDGWTMVPMGGLCSIQSGKSDTKDAVPDGPYAFFDRSKTIKKSTRFLHDCEALIIPGEGAEFLPRYFAGKFDLHQRAYALYDFSRDVDVQFLYYYLHYSADYFPRVAVGATVKSLRRRHFEQLPVRLTSRAEQRRIVAILDEAFEAIATAKANTEKNILNARELFEAYLLSAVTRQSENWTEQRIPEVAWEFGRGKSKHRPRNDLSLYGGKTPFIQTGDISQADHWLISSSQTYSEKGLAQSKLWPSGTVCIAIVGATVGETAILDFDACFPDSVIGIVVDERRADNEYVEYLLRAYKPLLKEKGKGTARDNINLGTFENERFPFPPLDQQRKIATRLNTIRETVQTLFEVVRRKVLSLEELKKSLLHQAFTGALTAKSTDLQVAEVA